MDLVRLNRTSYRLDDYISEIELLQLSYQDDYYQQQNETSKLTPTG